MISGERWTLGHRPALDGLRGVAIGLVLLGHGEVPGFVTAGRVGVSLFFVLSGFLITALLVQERGDTGRIDLRAFYARRLRRLGPAFALCFVVTCALGLAAGGGGGYMSVRDAVLAVSYVGNWYPALTHTPRPAPLGALTGTWSLAVEEQFYLVWPAVLILAARSGIRRVGLVAAVGVALSLTLRILLAFNGATDRRIYNGTDTNALALLLGAMVAVAVYRGQLRRLSAGVTPIALGGLCCFCAVTIPWAWAMLPVVACAAAAVSVLGGGPVDRRSMLDAAWLRWLGRRSYAVYLWNCLLSVTVYWLPLPWPVRLGIVVLPSLLLAELSWRCVESPFLRRSHADAGATLVRCGREGVAATSEP